MTINNFHPLLGAVAGDIIGSVYEQNNIKHCDFDLFSTSSCFTDDTVMTMAVAYSFLSNESFTSSMQEFGRNFPDAGYGGNFYEWIFSDNPQPYNSWGNGSAMRVSPVGYVAKNLDEALALALETAEVSHSHPAGITGAQAVACSVFLAKSGASKDEIKTYISNQFPYDLSRKLDDIRPFYKFDVSCQGSVPEAIIAFLESSDYENAIRLAISIGGDSDTTACITGSIACAFYKEMPTMIVEECLNRLPESFIHIIEQFSERFNR